jgi:hypothetical protein
VTVPVYVYDRRRTLLPSLVGLSLLSLIFLPILYSNLISANNLQLNSEVAITYVIVLLVGADIFVGYIILRKTFRIEFYEEFLRIGRGSKKLDYAYSDLEINRVKLELQSSAFNSQVYSRFTISSKNGDRSVKWTLVNSKIENLDIGLLKWLEGKIEYDRKVETRDFRISSTISLAYPFIFVFALVYTFAVAFSPISNNFTLELLGGGLVFAAALGCGYLTMRVAWKRGEKIRAIMEKEGYHPKNYDDFKKIRKELKEKNKLKS